MFRFIHAADVHLDSPLRGLESYEDAPVEEILGATRRAFDNLMELAIEEDVSFVLLAGDLYDGEWKQLSPLHRPSICQRKWKRDKAMGILGLQQA